jgi:hypothetical protein
MPPGLSQNAASASVRMLAPVSTPTNSQTTIKEWLSRDQILKTGGLVQNVKEVRTFLEQGGIFLDDESNTSKLAETMLQASTDSSTRAMPYLCAFSLILELYEEDKLVATMEEQLGNQMSEVSRLLTAFESQNTVFRTGINKLREHMDKLESTDSYIREVAKDILDKFTLQAKCINQPQATDDNTATIPVSAMGINTPQTYAAATQQGEVTQKPRQAILDKNQGRNKHIIIDAKGDNIGQLTEETLVTKANMAIKLMKTNKHPDKLENAKFVSAKKL